MNKKYETYSFSMDYIRQRIIDNVCDEILYDDDRFNYHHIIFKSAFDNAYYEFEYSIDKENEGNQKFILDTLLFDDYKNNEIECYQVEAYYKVIERWYKIKK